MCGWDLGRKITSRGANLLAQLLLQPNVSDLTGSYRLYKRAVFDNISREVTSKVRGHERVVASGFDRAARGVVPGMACMCM